MDIVYLPATEPDNETYGRPPREFRGHPDVNVHEVSYPHLVWYNQDVRAEARRQIEAMPMDRCVLVGFSKSGLGAWHLTREMPQRITATIIFDAPVATAQIPLKWGAGPFYDEQTWTRDLPVHGIGEFRRAVSTEHRLILISGASFHAEMERLSRELTESGLVHTCLQRQDIRHHWEAGWVELGLTECTESR